MQGVEITDGEASLGVPDRGVATTRSTRAGAVRQRPRTVWLGSRRALPLAGDSLVLVSARHADLHPDASASAQWRKPALSAVEGRTSTAGSSRCCSSVITPVRPTCGANSTGWSRRSITGTCNRSSVNRRSYSIGAANTNANCRLNSSSICRRSHSRKGTS